MTKPKKESPAPTPPAPPKGFGPGRSKLDEKATAELVRKWRTGRYTGAELARLFGVSESWISRAVAPHRTGPGKRRAVLTDRVRALLPASADEIVKKLGLTKKQVENALFRISQRG